MATKTHCFVALYVGDSISTARLISASANTNLVKSVAEYLLHDEDHETTSNVQLGAVREGQRKALSLIIGSGE